MQFDDCFSNDTEYDGPYDNNAFSKCTTGSYEGPSSPIQYEDQVVSPNRTQVGKPKKKRTNQRPRRPGGKRPSPALPRPNTSGSPKEKQRKAPRVLPDCVNAAIAPNAGIVRKPQAGPIVIPSKEEGYSTKFPLLMPKELAYANIDPRDYLVHIAAIHKLMRRIPPRIAFLFVLGGALLIVPIVLLSLGSLDKVLPAVIASVSSLIFMLAGLLLLCEHKTGRLARVQRYCDTVTTAGYQWYFEAQEGFVATGGPMDAKKTKYYLVLAKKAL